MPHLKLKDPAENPPSHNYSAHKFVVTCNYPQTQRLSLKEED